MRNSLLSYSIFLLVFTCFNNFCLAEAKIKIQSSREWKHLKPAVREIIEESYIKIFGSNTSDKPKIRTKVILLNKELFFKQHQVPLWVAAIYSKGVITVPVSEIYDIEKLRSMLSHEYVHAVIDVLSNDNCVGWLNEGLAMQFEGGNNERLHTVLKQWYRNNKPMPLYLLRGGFTQFNLAEAEIAYGQSYIGSGIILRRFGWNKIFHYFEASKTRPNTAFVEAFGMTEQQFEQKLFTFLEFNYK